jgi:hypothetical protein
MNEIPVCCKVIVQCQAWECLAGITALAIIAGEEVPSFDVTCHLLLSNTCLLILSSRTARDSTTCLTC